MTEQVIAATAEIAEARARLDAAEADIRATMVRALATVRDAVESIIDQSGFSRAEVLGLSEVLAPEKAKRDSKASPDGGKGWALSSDQSKIYVRGRMPSWLSHEMRLVGMDPDKADERAAFRVAHMLPLG